GPAPVPVSLRLTLGPGWNDVDFVFSSATGERGDLGSGVISAAVAPDLTFTRVAGASGAARALRDDTFTARSIPPPPRGLAGDPEFVGNVASNGGDLWLAVTIAGRAGVDYR